MAKFSCLNFWLGWLNYTFRHSRPACSLFPVLHLFQSLRVPLEWDLWNFISLLFTLKHFFFFCPTESLNIAKGHILGSKFSLTSGKSLLPLSGTVCWYSVVHHHLVSPGPPCHLSTNLCGPILFPSLQIYGPFLGTGLCHEYEYSCLQSLGYCTVSY